ncbi:hypothetical protein OS493_007663 [Desmophyllum pertusum]|uniref:Uncharacterized protein n=1 Tax=Desmophyllum pertusum TaxID=174260 RepID=A0A9X0CND7_9CNID|nr:hypothetical protein OS493_007663 [Desmophyllum pertusum]
MTSLCLGSKFRMNLSNFHEKGLVIYLDNDHELSKLVLLKPEILVDIIIQLVTKQPDIIHQRGFRHDWKLLHNEGMLTKSLLDIILSEAVQENKEAITVFLEKYDLICPLAYNIPMYSSENGKELRPAHFVPSMLPIHVSADEGAPLWLDRTTDKKFYVFFKKFLPEPLFHCLLSRAHKNRKVEFPHSQPEMFRDVGKFWLSPRQPYRRKLIKDAKMIEVTFSYRAQRM